jgi:peptidoglycan/LPS O-acetylase OafA/YrhL
MLSWLSRLSLRRVITHGRYIPEVDGFRFLAIFIVVIAHTSTLFTFPSIARTLTLIFRREVINGKIGVYLFFTISGFILAMPFAGSHLLESNSVNITRYFKRRVTRLEPPYILIMLIRFPLALMYKHAKLETFAPHLIASLLYAHNLAYGSYSVIYPPAWSLEIEIQFYILAPLLATVYIIKSAVARQLLLAGAVLGSATLANSLIVPGTRLSLCILNYFQYFLAGFLLCEIHLTDVYHRLSARTWDLVGVLALLFILLSAGTVAYLVMPFMIISLYLAGLRGRIARALFSVPAITIIGGMCYSIYLTHMLVVTGVLSISSHFHWGSRYPEYATVVGFAMSIASVLMVGTVYFLMVERPCMYPKWPATLTRGVIKAFSRA